MIPLHVLARSARGGERWAAEAAKNPGLAMGGQPPARSLCRTVKRLVEKGSDEFALLAPDDLVLGRGFDARAVQLLEQLERDLPEVWGVAGNRGITWDGIDRFDLSSPQPGLGRTRNPRLVGQPGPDVLLLNLRNLRKAGVEVPPFPGLEGGEVALALECARAGLGCFVDSRLFAFRDRPPEPARALRLLQGDEFGRWYAERFLNHVLQTLYGPIDMSARLDYAFLDLHAQTGTRPRDIHQLEDRVQQRLIEALRPSVTIACRTRLNRPAMLARAVRSVATAHARSSDLDVRIRLLVSKGHESGLGAALEALRPLAGGLELAADVVSRSAERHSRTELMLEGLLGSGTDYVWFLDDDDFLLADAFRLVRGAFQPGKTNLVLCDAVVYRETWSRNAEGVPERLLDWESTSRYRARNYLLCLSGTNYIPNCSILFPTAAIRAQVEGIEALGDYNEDYFFLCLALAAPGAEVSLVHRPVAGISHHNLGNTVTEVDRSAWHWSYASFLGELLNSQDGGSPLLWDLGRAYARSFSRAPRAEDCHEFLKVYPPDEHGAYHESRSLASALAPGTHVQVHCFSLEDGLVGGTLRLDPGNLPAYVELESVSLLALGPGGEEKGEAASELLGEGLPRTRNMVRLPGPAGTRPRYLATGADPHLFLPLPRSLETGAPMRVECRLRYVPLADLAPLGFAVADPLAGVAPVDRLPTPNLQVFREHEGGFSEDRSQSRSLSRDGRVTTYRFRLPGELPRRLRIDTGEFPALVELHSLDLVAASGVKLFRFLEAGKLSRVPEGHQMVPVPGSGTPLRLLATGMDPFLVLEPPAEIRPAEDAVLEARLRHVPLPALHDIPFEASWIHPNLPSEPQGEARAWELKLYLPDEGSFGEERTDRALLGAAEDVQEHVFRFCEVRGDILRLDPGAAPAYVEFERLELAAGPAVEPVVWAPVGVEATPLPGADIAPVLTAPGGPLRLFATGFDPQLHLELPGGFPRRGDLELRVAVRRVALPQLKPHTFPVAVEEGAASRFRALARRLPELQRLQVYYPRCGGYAEPDSVLVSLEAGPSFRSYRLTLCETDGDTVRIDIGDCPALIEIRSLEVRSPASGVTQALSAERGFPGIVLAHGMVPLAAPGAEGSLGLVATGGDPQLELKLAEGVARGGPAELRIELRYRPLVGGGEGQE